MHREYSSFHSPHQLECDIGAFGNIHIIDLLLKATRTETPSFSTINTMDPSQQPSGSQAAGAPPTLSPEAIAFAGRMYDSARRGEAAVFEQALPAGLPPNMTNEKGDTLLMLAAYHGHADVVKLLIQHGADPNRVNDRGQSPLAGAVFKKEDDVIDALVEGGADPDYGRPSAMECVTMFNQEDIWKAKFEAAPGRGKAQPPA
ncbi:ankyrin repeat-containing domain protein [Trichoderma barbatum]